MLCRRWLVYLFFSLVALGQGIKPLIVIIGPPGAGKTTQTEFLRRTYKVPSISADEIVTLHKESLAKARSSSVQNIEPKLDPMMSRLVENELRAKDLSKGLILDGYPASKDQGDHLAKIVGEFGFTHTMVLHLKVPDEAVYKRLKDSPKEQLEDSLKSYHREMDFISAYYQPGAIIEVDGTAKPRSVSKKVKKLVDARLKDPAAKP